MRRVRFIMATSPYNKGEVAGFPDDEAEKLVNDGKAEFEKDEQSPVDRMQRKYVRKAAA